MTRRWRFYLSVTLLMLRLSKYVRACLHLLLLVLQHWKFYRHAPVVYSFGLINFLLDLRTRQKRNSIKFKFIVPFVLPRVDLPVPLYRPIPRPAGLGHRSSISRTLRQSGIKYELSYYNTRNVVRFLDGWVWSSTRCGWRWDGIQCSVTENLINWNITLVT